MIRLKPISGEQVRYYVNDKREKCTDFVWVNIDNVESISKVEKVTYTSSYTLFTVHLTGGNYWEFTPENAEKFEEEIISAKKRNVSKEIVAKYERDITAITSHLEAIMIAIGMRSATDNNLVLGEPQTSIYEKINKSYECPWHI